MTKRAYLEQNVHPGKLLILSLFGSVPWLYFTFGIRMICMSPMTLRKRLWNLWWNTSVDRNTFLFSHCLPRRSSVVSKSIHRWPVWSSLRMFSHSQSDQHHGKYAETNSPSAYFVAYSNSSMASIKLMRPIDVSYLRVAFNVGLREWSWLASLSLLGNYQR